MFAVISSCAIFRILADAGDFKYVQKLGLLILLAMAACGEKLCSIINPFGVKRDWIVVGAAGNVVALRAMNTGMRQIGLSCKLSGPLAIASICAINFKLAIMVNFALTLCQSLWSTSSSPESTICYQTYIPKSAILLGLEPGSRIDIEPAADKEKMKKRKRCAARSYLFTPA